MVRFQERLSVLWKETFVNVVKRKTVNIMKVVNRDFADPDNKSDDRYPASKKKQKKEYTKHSKKGKQQFTSTMSMEHGNDGNN